MIDTPLSRSIDRLAELTQGMPDAVLDRAWTWRDYDSEGARFAFFRTYEELRELAVNLRQERVARGLAFSSAQLILAQYHAAYNDLQAALLGVDAELAGRAPAPEGKEWPVGRTLAHIVGGDLGFFVVVKHALGGHRANNWRPAKASDDEWDIIAGMNEATYRAQMDGPFDPLRAFHRTLHARIVRELEGMKEEELQLPAYFWESGPMSLGFRLRRFESHMRQHTIQIDKALALLLHTPTEARRLLRLIYAALAEVEGVRIGAGEFGGDECRVVAEEIEERTGEITEIVGKS